MPRETLESLKHVALYNENSEMWNYGNTLEGKFRVPFLHLPGFMAIGLV